MRLIVSSEDSLPPLQSTVSNVVTAPQAFDREKQALPSALPISPTPADAEAFSATSSPTAPLNTSNAISGEAVMPNGVVTSKEFHFSDRTIEYWIQHYLTRDLHHGGFFRSQFAEMGDEAIAAKLHDAQIHCEYLGWVGGFTGIDCHETERLIGTQAWSDNRNGVKSQRNASPSPKPTTGAASGKCSQTVHTCSWRYAVDDAANAIRTAAILGSRALLVRGGPQGSHIRRHASRLFFNAVEELLPIAEDMEVILALGELSPLDLLAANAMPWWSLFGPWTGLMIDLDRWESPGNFIQLRQNIARIAPATVLIDARKRTIAAAMPLLQLFAEAGYDGDVLISLSCFDQIVAEQKTTHDQTTVPKSSHPSNPENLPHLPHLNASPQHSKSY
ncbi:MAG: hypothetical protein PHE53_07715 [Thermoguttaceae bacterium]|nr:hypothetical protein [Thermoguttaceae bacterium]